jgi:hypothetical protein
MKPLHIVLLVCAGALGGAVVTKVWHRHPAAVEAPAAVVAQVEQPAAGTAASPGAVATAAEQPSAVVPPAKEPAKEEVKPVAPLPDGDGRGSVAAATKAGAKTERQEAKPPIRFHKNPPPAHPRPVELGQAVPAAQAPVSAPPLQEVAPAPAPAPVREPEPPQQLAAPPPAAPEPEAPHKVTLNAGMLIPVRLVDGLSSDRNAVGDMFIGTLDRALIVDGFVIAERGAHAEGRVVAADRGTRVKGDASIAVELTRIHTSDGQDVAIETNSFERHATANHGNDAARVGGGAVIGAIIGALAGGGKGAGIGAGVGGGAGAGDVLLTRKPATLPSEMRINFRLRTSVTLTEKKG